MNKYLLSSIIMFVIASFHLRLSAQTFFNPLEFETRGTSFSFGLMENAGTSSDTHVYLDFTAYRAPADVTVTGPGYSETIRVPAFSSKRLEISSAVYSSIVASGSGTVENKAMYISSTDVIATTLTHAKGNSSDASLLYPEICLGSEYFASCLAPNGNGLSELLIVATEDATTVRVDLPAGVSADNFTGPSVNLNKGQVLQLQSADDLSGTLITSDCSTPIAVFSGNTLVDIAGTAVHQFVQMPQYENLSTRFIAPRTSDLSETYKIVSTQDNTTVDIYALDQSQTYNYNSISRQIGLLDNSTVLHSVTLDRGESFEFSTDRPVFVKSDDDQISLRAGSALVQYESTYGNVYRNYFDNETGKVAHSNATPIILTKTSKAFSSGSAFTSVVAPLRQLSNVALCDLKDKWSDREYYLTIATNDIDNVKINHGRLSDYASSELTGYSSPAPFWINDRYYEFKTIKLTANQKYLISSENGFLSWCYSVDPVTGDVWGEIPMHRSFPMPLYHELRFSENTIPTEYVSVAEFLSRFTFCIKNDVLEMDLRSEVNANWEFLFGSKIERPGGYHCRRSITRSENEDLQVLFDPAAVGLCPIVGEGERASYMMDQSWSDFDFGLLDYGACKGEEVMLDGFYGGIMYDQEWKVYAPGSSTNEADVYLDDKYSVSPIFKSNVSGIFRIELAISDPQDEGCVYDASGDYGGTVTVASSGSIAIDVVGTKTDFCVGETVTMATTGSGPHAWSVVPAENAIAGDLDQSQFSFEVLGPVTVSYESETAAGCPVLEVADLTGNVSDTPSVSIPSTELCSGLSILVQPQIDAASPIDTYLWSGQLVEGGYLAATGIRSPEVVLPFEADGSFDVRLMVTDDNGCVGRADGIVSAKAKPEIYAFAVENDGTLNDGTYSAFLGEYVDLTSDVSLVADHEYDVEWFTDGTTGIFSGTTAKDAMTNAVSENDKAILRITDLTSGCYNYDTVLIEVDGAPLQISSITIPSHYCDYDVTVLQPQVQGGSGDYLYEWETVPAGLLSAEQIDDDNITIDLDPGSYSFTLTVTDANSPETEVSRTVSFNVFSLPQTAASSNNADDEVCNDQEIQLSGNAVAGDGAIASHLWSSAVSGYLSSASDENVDFIPSPAGASRLAPGAYDFMYKVTDEYGCYASSSLSITVLDLPTVVFAATDQAACANSGLLEMSGETVTNPNGGGSGVYTHAQVSEGLFDTDAPAGNYAVTYTYTDAKGCVNESKTKNVVIWGRPVVALDETYSAFHGEKVLLNSSLLSVTPFDGTPLSAYKWTPADSVNNATSKFTQTTSRYGNQDFTLLATDENGCTGTDAISITIGSNKLTADIDVSDADKVLCNGESAEMSVIASGGSGSYTYSWTAQPADASLAASSSALVSVSPTVSTVYTVEVSDASSLSDESISVSFEIIVNQNPQVHITSDVYENLCQTHQVSLFGNAVHGSGESFTHKWTSSVANVLSAYTIENPVVTGISAQAYNLRYNVTDDNGCIATDDTTIVTNAMPRSVTFGTIGNFCVSADAVELTTGSANETTGSELYSGTGVEGGFFNPAVAGVGTHRLKYEYTTPAGCQDSAFINVEVYELPSLTFETLNPVCFDAPEVSLVATADHSGVGKFKNIDGLGVTGNGFTASKAGVGLHQLRYTFTDNNGCVDSIDQSIEVWELPVVDAGTDKNVTYGASPQLTPNVSKGTVPYSYSWTPADFLSSASIVNPTANSVTVSTLYEIEVTDKNGCKDNDDIYVNITSNALSVSISSDDPDICKFNSTELKVLPSGGSGNYTFTWTANGQTVGSAPQVTVSPEETTTYTVLVDDGDNAPVSETFVVTVYELPTVAPLFLDTVCQQTTGKTILGNATAGTNPIAQHIWKGDTDILLADNVENPEVNASLAPADAVSLYDLRYIVIDEHACSDTADIELRIDPNPVINIEERRFTTCVDNPKEIDGLPTGGSGKWASFEWVETDKYTLSATDVVNPVFTSSVIGPKRVAFTVTDTKGCSATADIIVITYSNPTVDLEENRTTACVADQIVLDGQPAGGNAPYVHLWRDPSGVLLSVDADTAVVNSVENGMYDFKYIVTDRYGCMDSAETSLRIYTNPVASLGSSFYSVCENTDLQLQGTPGAGATSYEYEWIGNSALLSATDITSPVFNASLFGTYEFEYVIKSNYDDLQICYDTAQAEVLVNENPLPDLGDDTVTCAGVDVVLALSSEGGDVASYQMTWTNDSKSLLVSDPYNVPFTKAEDGVYEVIVRVEDDSSCYAYDSINVEVYKNPTVSEIVDSICAGSDLVIAGNPQFGTSQEWAQHVWTGIDSEMLVADVATSDPVFNSTRLGEHFLNYEVVDANGCKNDNEVTIQVNDNPQPSISVKDTLEVCELADLQLNVSVHGLYGGAISENLSYSWSGTHSQYLNNQSSASPVFNYSKAGKYTLYVEVSEDDGENCSGVDSIVIKVNPLPKPAINSPLEICAKETLDIVGSTEYQLHNWKGLGIDLPISNPLIANPQLQTNVAGEYPFRYTAATAKGCVDSIDSVVVVHALPDINAGGMIQTYNGDTVQLQAQPIGDEYIYQWAEADSLITSNTVPDPQTKMVLRTTLYYLTVTDTVHGCVDYDEVMVVDTTGGLNVTIAPEDVYICRRDSAKLFALPGGGNPYGYSYLWEWKYGDKAFSSTEQIMWVKPNVTTDFIITLFDGTTGQDGQPRSVKDTLTVHVRQLPEFSLQDQEVCVFSSLEIDGGPIPQPNAEIDSTSHHWYGSNLSAFDEQLTSFYVEQEGVYPLTYEAADTFGCVNSVTVDVVAHKLPEFEIISDAGVCAGKGMQFSATISNGVIPAADGYLWAAKVGVLNSRTVPTPVLKTEFSGDYTVGLSLTDSNGCTDSTKKTVKVYSLPRTGLDTIAQICAAVELPLVAKPSGGSGGNYSHLWYDDPNGFLSRLDTSAITFASAIDTKGDFTYNYVVRDGNGCTDTSDITVTVRPAVFANISPDGEEVCAESELSLMSNYSGGTADYEYRWFKAGASFVSNTIDGAVFVHDSAETVTVYYSIKDFYGCEAEDSTTVKVLSLPEPEIISEEQVCQLQGIPLDAKVEKGNPDFMYKWSISDAVNFPGVINEPNLKTTSYTAGQYSEGFVPIQLDVEDKKGCKASVKKNINVKLVPYPHTETASYSVYSGRSISFSRNAKNLPGRVYSWYGDNANLLNRTDTSFVTFNAPSNETAADTTYILYCSITDTLGGFECSYEDQVAVKVWSRITVNFGKSSSYVCQGGSIMVAPSLSYAPSDLKTRWFVGENLIASDTTGTISVRAVADTFGLYEVQYEVSSEMNNFSDVYKTSLEWKKNPIVRLPDTVKAYYRQEVFVEPAVDSAARMSVFAWKAFSGNDVFVDDSVRDVLTKELTETDSFAIKVVDQFGCEDYDSMYVYVSDTIIQPSWNDSETVCDGQYLKIIRPLFGGEGSFNYRWTDMNGTVLSTSDTLVVLPTMDVQMVHFSASDSLAPSIEKDLEFWSYYQIKADFSYAPNELLTILDEAAFTNTSFTSPEEYNEYFANYSFVWDPVGDNMDVYTGYDQELRYGPYDEMGTYNAKLIAIDNLHNCHDTVVKPVEVAPDPNCFITYPNAFMPNTAEDGYFNPAEFRGIIPETYEIKIYNRWGQMLFNSTDIDNGWEGQFKNKPASQDVYVFQTTAQCQDGKPYVMNGDVTLLR